MTPVDQALLQAKQLHKRGDLDSAEAAYQQALAAQPEHADALFFLGLLRHDRGDNTGALELMQRAIALRPDVAAYHFNIGTFFAATGRNEEAVAAYRRAIALDPSQSGPHNNLGLMLQELGRPDEAAESYKQALKLMPPEQAAPVLSNLANALQELGRTRESIERYAMAMALSPQNPVAHSNYVFALNYLAKPDRAAIFAAHRKYAERFERPVTRLAPRAPRQHAADGAPLPLRVGYVSCDFRRNAVAHFIEPVLAHHDRRRVEVFCYSNHTIVDDVTRRLKGVAHHWRDVADLSDDEAARLVREDGIDVLIDLTGHAGNDRLMLFARKPAPVQATWIGYPNTTGLSSIDYRITDALCDPPGQSEAFHTEKLFRLPDCFSCFQPPTEAPEVGPLPATAANRITFGSFNNLLKISPEVVEVWSRILNRVPGSRLILKSRNFHSPSMQALIRAAFAKHGVSGDRLDLLGSDADHAAHLGCYNHVDLGLDPFPYNGTTTTLDALWMGVPVITLAGESHVSRVGVSQLTNIGLPELIARDKDEYVEIAAALAGDLPRLAAMRKGLRQRMRQSPLTDAPRFTRHLENAYQSMWDAFVAERKP
ncbi:MAG: tetratricopeptide repeat protein [Planctomycetes bacterium]|nr:tetratricopeptide repeat protein [Planctomycetota bacterium]